MYGDLGFYLMMTCLVLSVYGFVASLMAARLRHRRLFRSSRAAITTTGILCFAASILMWIMLFSGDFSLSYVARNSSLDLPMFFKFTAFWSALEGSHLLWTLLISFFATLAVWVRAKDNDHIMPYVMASLQAIQIWMFYLCVSYSDPFVRVLPAPPDGSGMNALLQNFYMAIHPPMLFCGYTTMAIPFAYCIAALMHGDVTAGWLRTVRRWALVAWCFLSGGIFLGGRWAYVELGWAGYWAWDPVENSSFMPWILTTALLHALLVQEKLGQLKRLSLVLGILAFFFSYFGTFITRSGIIESVHSFATSPIGPNYLTFLGIFLGLAITLYAARAPMLLPAKADKVWGVSKESALIVTQFLLLTLFAIVLVGTIFPIVTEALSRNSQKITVQGPYFNTFAPFIGLALVVAIAIGNIMRFHTSKIPNARLYFGWAWLGAVPLAAFLCYQGEVMATPRAWALAAQVVGMLLCCWSAVVLWLDGYTRVKTSKLPVTAYVKRNTGYLGGLVAHTALLVAIVGFLGNYRGVHDKATLKTGEAHEMFGYTFTFEGIKVGAVENATVFQAPLKMTRGGRDLGTITPIRSKYPTSGELYHEVGIRGSLWHDVYITLADFDKSTGNQATFEFNINPTVRIVWISGFLLVIGGLIALADRSRGIRSRDTAEGAFH